MKKPYKFQGGGSTQVYRIENNQYQPVNYGMPFQAASMPIASGLEPYIQLEQLENQRAQLDLQEKEFDFRMKTTEKNQLRQDLRDIQSVNDDFLKLKFLPSDVSKVEELKSRYFDKDLMKLAASGDQNAINQLLINSRVVMADPIVGSAISRKAQNDDNIERWSKLSDIEYKNVTNRADAYQAIQAGEPMPAPRFDDKNLKADLDLKIKAQSDKLQAEADLAAVNALKTKAELEYFQNTSDILKELKLQDLEKLKIQSELDRSKLEEYKRLRAQGMDSKEASRRSGLTDKDDKPNNMFGYATMLADEQKISLEKALEIVANIANTSKVEHSGGGDNKKIEKGESASQDDLNKGADISLANGMTIAVAPGEAKTWLDKTVREDVTGLYYGSDLPTSGQNRQVYIENGYLITNDPEFLVEKGIIKDGDWGQYITGSEVNTRWMVPLSPTQKKNNNNNSEVSPKKAGQPKEKIIESDL